MLNIYHCQLFLRRGGGYADRYLEQGNFASKWIQNFKMDMLKKKFDINFTQKSWRDLKTLKSY